MVELEKSFASVGRNLGNKLFTYAVGSIIAKELDYSLIIPDNALIRRKGIVGLFPYKSIYRKEVNTPVLTICDGGMQKETVNGVIQQGRGKKIKLTGYYLKYENIKPYKDHVRDLYSNLYEDFAEPGSAIILLRNSTIDPTFTLPDKYYLDQLEGLNFNKLYISFDHFDRHRNLIDKLAKYNPILLDLDILELFKKITTMETIVASQGTFSFWASFLSNAKTIVWPVTKIGPNKTSDPNVNLIVDDQDRYNFIDVNNG